MEPPRAHEKTFRFSFLTLSYRKRYRSLRKKDVENQKLFDVNDLPEADQK